MDLTPIPNKILLRHGILEEYHDKDFHSFPVCDKYGREVPERKKVLDLVMEYVKNLDKARRKGIGLMFYGPNGVGKTLLAVSVQKAAIRKGYRTQFSNLSGIMRLIRKSWSDEEAEETLDKRVRNVDFLIIDDVGKEYKAHNNDLVEVMFDELIRYRSNRLLPIIITTNTSLEDMREVYGNSLISLLEGKCIKVEMIGKGFPDWRKTVYANQLLDWLKN